MTYKYEKLKTNTIDWSVQRSLPPVLPELSKEKAPKDVYVARYFDSTGKFIGWCLEDAHKKFILGKLYYKTKGAYTTKTRNGHDDSRRIYITEKAAGGVALFIIVRKLADADLVDLTDKEALAKMTLEKLNEHSFSTYYYSNYPDPYNIIPKTVREEVQQMMNNCLKQIREHVINNVQDQVNAEVAQKQFTHVHGVSLADL